MKKADYEKAVASAAQTGNGQIRCEADGKTYIRKLVAKDRLILLGGGHICVPVCKIASLIGFDVTVVDDRPDFANYERFPEAAHVMCDEFRKAIRDLEIRPIDYVCVITRGHRWDGDCLREILSGVRPSYLGMIGSRRRIKGLYGVLEEEGFDRQELENIHAPIGVDIGAVTPAEIAVSICGELVKHRRAGEGNSKEEAAGNLSENEITLDETNIDTQLVEFIAGDDTPKAMMVVLETKGSTPAAAGAMMAIDRIGRSAGTIGGGCSEAEILLQARDIAGTGGSLVTDIDMTNDMAAEEGMVCGGTMRVLIEDVT